MGYLSALYRGNNALKLWMQKSLVAERMARGLDESPKPQAVGLPARIGSAMLHTSMWPAGRLYHSS